MSMAQITTRTHFSCRVKHELCLHVPLPGRVWCTAWNTCIVLILTSGQRCPGLHEVCEGCLQLGRHDEGEEAEECEGEPQHQGDGGGGHPQQRGHQPRGAGPRQQDPWVEGR